MAFMASDSDDDMSFDAKPFQESDSEDDLPLAHRTVPTKPGANGNAPMSNGAYHVPTAADANGASKTATTNGYDSSSSDDDIPLGS